MMVIDDFCRQCGEIAESTICEVCAKTQTAIDRAKHDAFYTRDEQKRMAKVVDKAKRDKTVVCWLCLSRKPPPVYDGVWVADHERPRDPTSPLHAAHRGCNSARGNRAPSKFRQSLVRKHPKWFEVTE